MKKLGFGFMRLPLLDKDDVTSIDYEALNPMVDKYLERGFTYFDTAYLYHRGFSEVALSNSLVKRHTRNSYTIASKMTMAAIKPDLTQEAIFADQLNKLGIEYFDYYLIHNMGVQNYKLATKYESFEFALDKVKAGFIKELGFSFHDTPELLDQILTDHPEVSFVQLQINYLDWENESIQSRRCYEVARKHNKKIIVMEPVKGGTLVNIPEAAKKRFKDYNPNASIASWAIRYVASLEGVHMVLSGMSNMDHVLDNTSYMQDFKPLNSEESRIIQEVVEIINEQIAIPCTACEYCVEDCPKQIAIPKYFALYNNLKQTSSENFTPFVYYANYIENNGKASDCIGCKACERHCPQHIKITEHLKEIAKMFE